MDPRWPLSTLRRIKSASRGAWRTCTDAGAAASPPHGRSGRAAVYLLTLPDDTVSRVSPDRRGDLGVRRPAAARRQDRKSTRLNSSHLVISYAVFCLKKKNNK